MAIAKLHGGMVTDLKSPRELGRLLVNLASSAWLGFEVSSAVEAKRCQDMRPENHMLTASISY